LTTGRRGKNRGKEARVRKTAKNDESSFKTETHDNPMPGSVES